MNNISSLDWLARRAPFFLSVFLLAILAPGYLKLNSTIESLKACRHNALIERPVTEAKIQWSTSAEQNIGTTYLELLKLALTDIANIHDPSSLTLAWEGRFESDRALTMIGMTRLNNLQFCMEDVIQRGVPGDFIEAGAWRGGATIFMRGVLKARDIKDRKVWVSDSFEGMPEATMAIDKEDHLMPQAGQLAVSLESVKGNFTRYGLLDDQVGFLKGWFKDTFPTAPIDKLAVLRIDADLYESTMEALIYLYPKVSPGGYIIVDDAGAFPACMKAVHDFRTERQISDPLIRIDWTGVYWQKSKNDR